MMQKVIGYFYPDIQKDEIRKTSLLALALIFTIGTYWLMRLLKDLVLYKLAFPPSLGWDFDTGRSWIPTVKTLSPLFVFALVMIYSRLIDIFEKHQLMYIVATFYMIVFSGITSILYLKHAYGEEFLGRKILAISGILGYLFTESFGSLMVALFWSFTISASTSEQAKRTFPFIIAAGQFGAITGSALMLINTNIIWPFYAIVVACLATFIAIIAYLVKTTPAEQLNVNIHEKPAQHHFFSGLQLLVSQPYLLGILVISTIYEIAATLIEFQMNSQASAIFDATHFKWFKGIYGISINTLACLIALLGTSYLIKKFDTKICLLIYPTIFALGIATMYGCYHSFPFSANMLLWGTFSIMLLIKALSYALNNPVKEIMYIPTSKDAKFKTKSFIDIFASRSAKMTGAQIAGWLNVANNPALSIHHMITYGSLINFGIIGVWMIAAIYVGTKNQKLIANNEIIE